MSSWKELELLEMASEGWFYRVAMNERSGPHCWLEVLHLRNVRRGKQRGLEGFLW